MYSFVNLEPPPFSKPIFPVPVRILGSNGAITRATLEVIPRHNTITSNTWIYPIINIIKISMWYSFGRKNDYGPEVGVLDFYSDNLGLKSSYQKPYF